MKVIYLITLFISFVAAVDFAELNERQRKGRPHKKTSRPKKYSGVSTMRAPHKPASAPSAYRVDLGKPSRSRSKASLKKLPAEYIDPDNMRRSIEAMRAVQRLKRQSSANDFFECQSSVRLHIASMRVKADLTKQQNPAPSDMFSYQTCEGFFCSLCETLQTNTDFIGNQLSTAEALCVSNGDAGTVVGEDPPQWDAGFVYTGNGLPTYDVC
ncbi:hypothetical protein UCRPA7_4193 [Phaeoacremonium minimum UCRPA7]|uniref:Uncharacterized protein n=1 Tax=Phaeoacremonium minimum (strain UCR-PA7) TaxID=1286976 RepID=R8BLR2_PHAM7|nr:hypothetical protein UCRPA7_4193 [Phaeoacremonium minimum UCRPA7]EOO00277.1 hypothetical protein UCRPA7_4193 [Phaeoacremonium minimum UCRPA7]